MEEGECNCCGKLKKECGLFLREKEQYNALLEDLMRENGLKSKECQEAQPSLHELKMELMWNSMHVSFVALALEVQVKEKSR